MMSLQNTSVADPGGLSPIPDPDFCPSGSRISDPGFKNSHKNHKIENYINFELLNLQRIMELSTQKIVIKLLNMIRDP
jgi:hypothetical protein